MVNQPFMEVSMREVTYEQVMACLKAIGVMQGDGLLIHSAVQFLGRPVGGIGLYLQAIQTAIGPQGTLVVPTFNFGFAHGEPYDPLVTPSKDMGVFSEYIRQQPDAKRSRQDRKSVV